MNRKIIPSIDTINSEESEKILTFQKVLSAV
jgi:hypothetical protein